MIVNGHGDRVPTVWFRAWHGRLMVVYSLEAFVMRDSTKHMQLLRGGYPYNNIDKLKFSICLCWSRKNRDQEMYTFFTLAQSNLVPVTGSVTKVPALPICSSPRPPLPANPCALICFRCRSSSLCLP